MTTFVVVPPGRWIFPNPRAGLINIASLTENQICYETLSIIRVQRGEVGLATKNGYPIILDEGLHVHNSRVFKFEKFTSINVQYLQHGSIHIIRVPQGSYGFITESIHLSSWARFYTVRYYTQDTP